MFAFINAKIIIGLQMECFSCHVTVIILSTGVCVYHHIVGYKHVDLYVHGSVMVFEMLLYMLFTFKRIVARITYLMPVFAKQEANKDLLLFRGKCCARHVFLLVVQKVIEVIAKYYDDDGTTTTTRPS